jgi:hypothetical protein
VRRRNSAGNNHASATLSDREGGFHFGRNFNHASTSLSDRVADFPQNVKTNLSVAFPSKETSTARSLSEAEARNIKDETQNIEAATRNIE